VKGSGRGEGVERPSGEGPQTPVAPPCRPYAWRGSSEKPNGHLMRVHPHQTDLRARCIEPPSPESFELIDPASRDGLAPI
jgi:hypothetical protein